MVNEWTREDLPSVMDLVKASVDATAIDPSGGADAALDAAVAHLNAHHPKPGHPMDPEVTRMRRERDESLRKKGEAFDRAVRAERERDAALARAEWAELRCERMVHEIECHSEGARRAQNALALLRERVYAAIEAEQAVDPVESRARELAEAFDEGWKARTAPAVTHHEVNHAVRTSTGKFDLSDNLSQVVDAVWSLVSGADPAVFVVRESDLPEVWRDNRHNIAGELCRHWWTSDGDWAAHQDSDAREARTLIPNYLRKVAGWEATARAIEAEAEQAVDPVEEKARSEADRRYSGEPNHAFIEGAVWAARHLNEREASDE